MIKMEIVSKNLIEAEANVAKELGNLIVAHYSTGAHENSHRGIVCGVHLIRESKKKLLKTPHEKQY